MKFYKPESKAEEFYAKLTERYPKGIVDAVYEDAIIDCVGINGLHLLIETCGILEGRKLYAI